MNRHKNLFQKSFTPKLNSLFLTAPVVQRAFLMANMGNDAIQIVVTLRLKCVGGLLDRLVLPARAV
jgi:hypothetical protein